MAKKDERYLNVTLKNEQDDNNDIIVSLHGIFKKLKKYFLFWIIAAFVSGVLVTAFSVITSPKQHKNISALVSFSYDGIEKGLDPNGNILDLTTFKTPSIIEAALTELELPIDNLEDIRQNISVEPVMPPDAIDKITTYKSIYENSSGANVAMTAAQAMLDTKYYPTQFKIHLNYGTLNMDSQDAAEMLNCILDKYREYFMANYGYNESLGSAIRAIDYQNYDYAEALDIFDSTLGTLKGYVDALNKKDTTRFRSSQSGYTFKDLSNAISTIQSIDIDVLSSYINVNNVTKDKDTLITYYQYRIDSLTRNKTEAEEQLAAINDSINTYQKDQVVIVGNGTDNTTTQFSQSSDQYDSLFNRKLETQEQLSSDKQRINYYTQRIKELNSKPAGNDEKKEKVDAKLASLNEKLNQLIEDVNVTADEYYATIPFANSYNILVPATSVGFTSFMSRVIGTAKLPVVLVEAVIFLAYICTAFITAVIAESKKKKMLEDAENSDDNDDDSEENAK